MIFLRLCLSLRALRERLAFHAKNAKSPQSRKEMFRKYDTTLFRHRELLALSSDNLVTLFRRIDTMRYFVALALVTLALLSLPNTNFSQGGQMEASRGVAGGGISVPGWSGKIDAREEAAGMTLNSAKFTKEGDALHVTTGPAVTYWNANNKATDDYTVKATFNDPKYMNLNNHPHPYGVMIAGNDLGTDQQSYLYCAAYGDGKFIVRGFGPAPFQMNGRGAPDPAVNKAAAVGQPVEQEIAMSVKGDKVSCSINKKEVWAAAKSDLVTAGRMTRTDGMYGLRSAHNTEVFVTGLKMSKN